MQKIALFLFVLVIIPVVYASDEPPGVITDFCVQILGGDIAFKSEPFNATDVITEELPSRRILGYFVTSSTSYLWYEHGGRGYHQHLVRFSTSSPSNIQASYVFAKSQHRHIDALIRDSEFLRNHVSKDKEF